MTVHCPSCGEEIEGKDISSYCPYCGVRINEKTKLRISKKKEKLLFGRNVQPRSGKGTPEEFFYTLEAIEDA